MKLNSDSIFLNTPSGPVQSQVPTGVKYLHTYLSLNTKAATQPLSKLNACKFAHFVQETRHPEP